LGQGGYPRVPCGVGTGGRKFPRERGGAGMGDGAGIMGRGRGIGSSPQTRPIAIPNSNNKISSKAAQQNSIISSIHQMRDREREREKKKKKTN
jgi:hypothetical protein